MNPMAVMIKHEYDPREEIKKPTPLCGEGAAAMALRAGEFGLLDIVLLDAIVTQDADCKP